MSHRLETLVEQLRIEPADEPVTRSIKQRLALQSLRAQMTMSADRLREMAAFMVHEMTEGLRPGHNSTLPMLPSYVYQRSTAGFSGVVFALDLGGTNFRVIRMQLENGRCVSTQFAQNRIPEGAMRGSAEQLFGFIAQSVKNFLDANPVEPGQRYSLGFTFSFPVTQTALNAGRLMRWTKGFTTSGVEGEDVVRLLQRAMDNLKLPLNVTALCNDTVGTLVTRYFSDQSTTIGCILGTGANACYWENVHNITKAPEAAAGRAPDAQMVINIEFGGFDSQHCYVLPITSVDADLDRVSPNPGGQRLEKLISGMYLGEIVRRLLVLFSNNGILPPQVAQTLQKPYSLPSGVAGRMLADRSAGLHLISQLLERHFNCKLDAVGDRLFVRQVCGLVMRRSAQLAGMAIAAILMKTGHQDNATVAVDGAVFLHTPGYHHQMQDAMTAVVGDARGVRLVFTADGSGLGAGYIAALAAAK